MYHQFFGQWSKSLAQLAKWLDAAREFGVERGFDSNVFCGQRLAPDQFTFARQVQATCDLAKLAAARLAGREAPSHPDTEQTLDELSARVAAVIKYLASFSAADFEGAAERKISQPRWEGKWMRGDDYFLEHAQPNFYFHLTHAYAILRHNGVNVGKRDYLGSLSLN